MRLLAALFAIPLLSCSSLISFDVDSSGTSTIPGSPTGGLLGLPGFSSFNNFNIAQSSQFQNNNTNKDHISECRLTKLSLKVVSPTGNTLAFLTKIDFFIEAPNLPKVHIAGLTPVPGTVSADLSSDGSKLLVCDKDNNRVLIWNTVPTTNGQPADVVVGQTDFTSSGFGTSSSSRKAHEGSSDPRDADDARGPATHFGPLTALE